LLKHVVKLGQQKQPKLHPQTPLLHWLPSGALEHPATQDPPEQHPPLQTAEALQEVPQAPPWHAIPFGQSVGPVHAPPSWGTTVGPSVLASMEASDAASTPLSSGAPLEVSLDPLSEELPLEAPPDELLEL
jgi:hypothetical protein